MSTEEVLAEVLRAGGRVISDPARPRLVVPPALKSLVLEHRAALRALILAGVASVPAVAPPSPLAVVPDAPRRPFYAAPWPDSVPGLGARTVGRFDPCEGCGSGSWVRYGCAVLCLMCAERRIAGAA